MTPREVTILVQILENPQFSTYYHDKDRSVMIKASSQILYDMKMNEEVLFLMNGEKVSVKDVERGDFHLMTEVVINWGN